MECLIRKVEQPFNSSYEIVDLKYYLYDQKNMLAILFSNGSLVVSVLYPQIPHLILGNTIDSIISFLLKMFSRPPI